MYKDANRNILRKCRHICNVSICARYIAKSIIVDLCTHIASPAQSAYANYLVEFNLMKISRNATDIVPFKPYFSQVWNVFSPVSLSFLASPHRNPLLRLSYVCWHDARLFIGFCEMLQCTANRQLPTSRFPAQCEMRRVLARGKIMLFCRFDGSAQFP